MWRGKVLPYELFERVYATMWGSMEWEEPMRELDLNIECQELLNTSSMERRNDEEGVPEQKRPTCEWVERRRREAGEYFVESDSHAQ